MSFYEHFLRPILFQLDPESAHDLVQNVLVFLTPLASLLPKITYSQELRVNLAGLTLPTPVGLAAGLDKNGKLLSFFEPAGFGFAEIGSITARESAGNPKPRLFRFVDDSALVNRMGLNGDGAAIIAKRLAETQKCESSVPLGLNITKTNDPSLTGQAGLTDILSCFDAIKHLQANYLTINVSCPNTEEGKLESIEELEQIMQGVQARNQRRLPIFVKLSPDSEEDFLRQIVAVCTKYGAAGYICGNTSVERPLIKTSRNLIDPVGPGGLSGAPLKPLSLKLVRSINSLKTKDQLIIGCGGILTGEDAYEFIKAGATVVQIYTALVFRGPFAAKLISEELQVCLQRDRTTISQACGSDLAKSLTN
jgi:dihydroorotate dehydrogenase